MEEATKAERDRCVAIIDRALLECGPEAERWLIRVRNLIAAGATPQTFREQIAGEG